MKRISFDTDRGGAELLAKALQAMVDNPTHGEFAYSQSGATISVSRSTSPQPPFIDTFHFTVSKSANEDA